MMSRHFCGFRLGPGLVYGSISRTSIVRYPNVGGNSASLMAVAE